MKRIASVVVALMAIAGCQKSAGHKDKSKPSGNGSAAAAKAQPPSTPGVEQVTPPFDLKTPPADAQKTASGLVYKKITSNDGGTPVHKNDTVLMNYNAWKQASGETFFTTKGRGQPMPLNLANAAPGFVEGLSLLKKGEHAMLWIPPELGYKQPPKGAPETLVFEVDITDIIPAPEVPADVSAPPATAETLPSGVKYVVVKPGTGTVKPRAWDTVTYNFTAWDSAGHQFDSTEVRKRPATLPPFRQNAAMQDILTTLVQGERVRAWIDVSKIAGGKGVPTDQQGLVCYEVQLEEITKAPHDPPAVPKAIAAPPADAKKTEKGVSYVFLKHGKGGDKPGPKDSVKVDYTGWTTDGRMFDSSVVRGEPAQFALNGVIAGWTDGLQVLAPGDEAIFWIPEELAYKGNPGRPQGMLVFQIGLIEVQKAAATDTVAAEDGNKIPAPPDVAKPPADALKTPKGVFYKIIKAGGGTQHPTPQDTVVVNYSGWTTDGENFDASHGSPVTFQLSGLIPGWIEGIPMMAKGDSARMWIPQELAYGGQPGAPAGMLVFDIDLIDIKAAEQAGQQ